MKKLVYGLLLLPLALFPQNKKPNVLWIICEDLSPTLSVYGDSLAKTPNIDALAKESMVYENAFAAATDSGPSRSAIITGMLPSQTGTMHMSTGQDVIAWGKREYDTITNVTDIAGKPVREYSAVVPYYVKCFTEYLRAAGYYCTNNMTTNYQFAAPTYAWDENGRSAYWGTTPKGMPFFSVFTLNATHESKLWLNENLPLTVSPQDINIPPYLPDTEATRNTIAKHYSNVELLDEEVGNIIARLKKDGLYDNTTIFFFSDNGGPLPHQKREIYDTGLRVPFMVKEPGSAEKGRSDRLLSLTDLAPTMLSLAGIAPQAYLHGAAFMGKYKHWERRYVFATSDRLDEFTDRIRAVRSKKYLYVRNYHPELPKYKNIAYRKQVPMMPEFFDMGERWVLNDIQMEWFKPNKAIEELYDCEADPYNLTNVAFRPEYSETLKLMREECTAQFDRQRDYGSIPESEMIAEMWPGNVQPKTRAPEFEIVNGWATILNPSLGLTFSYLIADSGDLNPGLNDAWKVYNKPVKVDKGKYIYFLAERIGYKDSDIIVKQNALAK